MLSGITAHDKAGNLVTGTIASQAAQTITPGTTKKTIAAGKYLSGAQTIAGDTNLIANNIKSGISIFGVTGTYESTPYAVIAVTYPEGSDCTCTKGEKVLKAKDTSGRALFSVSIGTWVVSCTDGTDTASKEVSITAEGQGVSVDLSYYVYFYKAGDECESITGGWKNQLGSLKKSADHMHLSAAAIYSQAIATTANPLDMSGIKTLCFDVQYSALYGGNTVMGLVTGFQGASSGGDIGSYSVCEAAANTADRAIYTIDVSKLSGKYYPYIRSRWGDLGDVQVDIFNVYGIPA